MDVRSIFLRFVLVCCPLLAALGCGTSQPAPPPPVAAPPTTTTSDQKPPVASSNTAAATSQTAPATDHRAASGQSAESPASSSSTPPAPTDKQLRELAARYLEGDGAGGWRTNEQAALALDKLGPAAAAGLVPLLADVQVEVRRGAAFYLLGSFDPNDAGQVQAFAKLLSDEDRTTRGIGLSAVRQMHEKDQTAAVPGLAAMLDPAREDKAANRESVARLLASLKTAAAEATDALASAATTDPVPTVRGACLVALAQVVGASDAAPLVAKGLADKEASVRLIAAARLRQLGASSAPASKELAAALADDDSRVRAAAAETLVKVGRPGLTDITQQLKSQNVDARKLALYCLAKIGPPAKDAVPEVEKCLADSNSDVKKLAEAALKSIRAMP